MRERKNCYYKKEEKNYNNDYDDNNNNNNWFELFQELAKEWAKRLEEEEKGE